MEITKRPARALVALLVACVAGCEREPAALRRPWASATDVTALTYDGTTMLGRRLAPERREHTWVLGATRAGEVWVAAAVEGSPGARATLELTGASAPATCTVEGPARWQPCRLAVAAPVEALGLRVRVEGPPDARAAVSSPLVRTGPASPALVLVILLDTLRYDRVRTYAPAIPLGDALDELARDGVTFERAYSTSSWTRTAVATLFTGLDATSHGVLGRDDTLPADLPGLPHAMQRAGYRTVAWSTNPNVLPVWGFAAGFDAFHDLGASAWPKEKVPAASVFAAARAALAADGGPRPLFLYLHLMDPHAPYRPQAADHAAVQADAALLATFPGRSPTSRLLDEYARYLGEIRGMDRELGAFLADLRAEGAYRDAMILVLSDHGEEFLDHGGTRHGKTLYEEVLRVPAILKLPGNALAGTRIAREVGLADLGPTMLGALGIAGLPGVDGRDLWDRDHRRLRDEAGAQTAVLKLDTHHKAALVSGDRKLILDHFGSDELFDLAADPREQRNLLPASTAVADEMRRVLDARIARHEAGWHVRICGGDDEERRRLRMQVRGDARGALLEADDAVRLVERRDGVAHYEVDLALVPRPSERLVNGRLWKGLRPDEDDIVVAAPDAPTLTIADAAGAGLRYAVGSAETQHEGAELVAHVTDPVLRVRPSDAIDCRPQSWTETAAPGGRASYVRVWYVPHAERLEDGQVAGELQERLRALGYQR